MGSRLRKLKEVSGKKKMSDGKTIGGKGRLDKEEIKRLTIYYGSAIRNNSTDVKSMRQAIWAIWCHKASTDKEPKHWFCPEGEESWCSYNVAVHFKREAQHKHKTSLPQPICDAIKPIFKDLSDPKLLIRCLGGKTQNPNESLNALI